MSDVDCMPAFNRRALFWICVLALFTAAFANALRIGTSGAIQADIFDKIDSAHSAQMIGAALGAAFSGFALALLLVSPILDILGAKRVVLFAALCYIAGPLLIDFAPKLASTPTGAGDLVWWGMGLTGLAWGCTEGSINPVVASLYPEQRIIAVSRCCMRGGR